MIKEIAKLYYNFLIYPKYPLMAVVYLNNFCNLKCSFCDIGQRNSIDLVSKNHVELSQERIDEIIRLCLNAGTRRIYITGGEPFLSRNIWYFLEKCQENKIIVEDITTNGTLLSGLTAREIELINRNVLDIIISIDSADEFKHDESRGIQGTYQKIRSFLLNQDKRKLFKCNFSFNVVVTNRNINELKEVIELASFWRIKHINFQPISTGSIFVDMQRINDKNYFVKDLDLAHFASSVESIIRYSNDLDISTSLPVLRLWISTYFKFLDSDSLFFNFFPEKILCSKVFNYLHINYNGDLISCTNLKPIVNIDDKDCFGKWQANGQLLKKMFREKKYFDSCRYCFCDFPINLRISLLYYPFNNWRVLVKLAKYYLHRAKVRKIIEK